MGGPGMNNQQKSANAFFEKSFATAASLQKEIRPS
jgi:hypothetical protein